MASILIPGFGYIDSESPNQVIPGAGYYSAPQKPVPGKRAVMGLVILNGELVQSKLSPGMKPLVYEAGRLRERVASEGVPLVLESGQVRFLADDEVLATAS